MSWYPSTDRIDQSQKPNPNPPARKPTSQKDAMMLVGPKEEDVDMLMMVCNNMARSEALRYLKAKRNDVTAAINAALDGEDISKELDAGQWDEGMMSADREGAYDPHLRPLAASAAATRPNSPAGSQRSNMLPTNKQEEDEDMQRAIALSQGGAGVYGQETGVVGPGGGPPTFGPARKEDYDKGQWAMVRTGASTSSYGHGETMEIIPDLEAEKRVLGPGEPRVFKHLPEGDYLPNFLAICATIPAAREALLMRDRVQADYGHEQDWWHGHSIARPKIVHVGDGSAVDPENDSHADLFDEVQRLMAFLATSDRSYGNVGALLQTDLLKSINPSSTRSRTLLESFLQMWTMAASDRPGGNLEAAATFTTSVGTNAPDGMDTPDLRLIDLQVSLGENQKADLFELLDGLLWETEADSTTMSDNFIDRPADVLVMRAHQTNPSGAKQLRLEVPAEFHVDKYLRENIAATRATRLQMADGKRRIAKIEEIEKKLRSWKHPKKNEQIDVSQLLKHTLGHYTGQNMVNAGKNDRNNTTDQPTEQPPHYQAIAAKLNKLMDDISAKLVLLASEKEKTRQDISSMSKAPPPGIEAESQIHRYTLRGVATKPNITYLLLPKDPETDIEIDEGDHTPSDWRWWRVEYAANTMKPDITKTRMAEFDVLRAVELEHSSALLVYASDSAVEWRMEEGLPAPLRRFVEQDNQLFATELQAAKNDGVVRKNHNGAGYGIQFDMTDVPRESVEGGRGSMDSTRGSFGGSEGGDPPGYDHFNGPPAFGMGPDIKHEFGGGAIEDGPVTEIHLPENEDDEGTEMVETGRGGLTGMSRADAGNQDDGVRGMGPG